MAREVIRPERIAVCISPIVASTTEKDGSCAGITCSTPKRTASSNEQRRAKNNDGRDDLGRGIMLYSLFVVRSSLLDAWYRSSPRFTASSHSGAFKTSRTERGSVGATTPGCISA